MWGPIVWLTVASCSAAAATEQASGPQLRVARGGGGGDCGAALLAARWAAARRECACLPAPAPAPRALLRRGPAAGGAESARRVTRHLVHPSADVCLLRLDRPYEGVHLPVNASDVDAAVTRSVWKWMKMVIKYQDDSEQLNEHTYSFVWSKYLPVGLFCLTIPLPIGLYSVFFVYVIFYTGSPCELVPYKNHLHDKPSKT